MTKPATFDRRPIFNTIRNLLRRGIRPSEVGIIDAAIDDALDGAALRPEPPTTAEHAFAPQRTSEVGIALIHKFESCAKRRADGKFQAYPDPGSRDGYPWTIGWGSTGRDGFNGGRIQRGTVWTKAQCDQRFIEDLPKYEAGVIRALGDALANTSQAQFDALVSFHYNTGAISRSTLTRKHVAGDHEGAAREFARWNKNDGRVLKGLVRRRAAEERLYRSGM